MMNELQKAKLAILQLHHARPKEWNIVVTWMNRGADSDDDDGYRVRRSQRAIRQLDNGDYDELCDWMNSIRELPEWAKK